MNYLQAIILGIIQGITEWLPVSSSGHLAIANQLLNIEAPILYSILLHLATLIVLFIFFYKDIIKTIKAFFSFNFSSYYGKLSIYIIISSIITGFFGFLFYNQLTSLFTNIKAIGIALLITSFLLILSKFGKNKKELNIKSSILLGLFQSLAIIPGISRSGSTISMGLFANYKKKEIIKLSFLIMIPAVIAAFILELVKEGLTISYLPQSIIGFITTIIVGYFSLKLLIKTILSNKFHYFAIYCFILGILLLI